MSKGKTVKPDLVIKLTNDQIAQVRPLYLIQLENKSGMVLGSLGTDSLGTTVALSYIPQKIALKIIDLANAEMGEENDVNS